METLVLVVEEAEVQAEKIEGIAKTIEFALESNPYNECMYAVDSLVNLLSNHTALLGKILKGIQQKEFEV